MNRSVLIVIVDFLLVSLLAFSRIDEPDMKLQDPGQRTTPAGPVNQRQDLMDTLKLSLSKEREQREQANERLQLLQAQLQAREQVLGDREKLIREAEQVLREKAAEAARLERERAALEQERRAIQSNVVELQSRLTNVLTEASLSRRHLEAVRNDLEARQEEEAILKRKLAELEKMRQAAEAERQRAEAERQQALAEKARLASEKQRVETEKVQLATQLQVAETEKRLVREQLSSVQDEVAMERQEKAKLQEHATKLQEHATILAEGVSELAEKSGELTEEIRDYRPLAPNVVFSGFVTNRVNGEFRAVRTGVFGREINREKQAKTVLVRQGDQVFALFHVNDTPLNFTFPGTDWDWLTANLRRGAVSVPVEQVSFLAVDPRVVVMPIPEAKALELKSKIYTMPKDPFKFAEAILVGANEGYYGECKFQMDAESPQYVRMQRERFSWLVGKFTPSSGDLVFTKGGELLGLMVNKEYCLLLTGFSPAYHIRTGMGISNQQTGVLLSQLYGQVARMPLKLQ